MSTIQLEDISVAYNDTEVGMPCVFIHGHPFNRTMWNDQIGGLATACRVIVPDLRGYGETTVISWKTLLEDFARDLARLLDALKVDQIVLGGLSMGGQIVLEFYRLFPQRVTALILADTFAQGETEEGYRQRYEMADRLVREGMQPYADEVLPKMVSKSTIIKHPDIADRVLEMMQTTAPEGAAAALRGRAERPDYTGLLSLITVPTLIVVGREDEFTPISDAEFMNEKIPNSRLIIIDDAGHMPNMECANVFNQAVLEFLTHLPHFNE
ncbi:MAG: alpha/beta hydrolase [Chloroflexota bacterium]